MDASNIDAYVLDLKDSTEMFDMIDNIRECVMSLLTGSGIPVDDILSDEIDDTNYEELSMPEKKQLMLDIMDAASVEVVFDFDPAYVSCVVTAAKGVVPPSIDVNIAAIMSREVGLVLPTYATRTNYTKLPLETVKIEAKDIVTAKKELKEE